MKVGLLAYLTDNPVCHCRLENCISVVWGPSGGVHCLRHTESWKSIDFINYPSRRGPGKGSSNDLQERSCERDGQVNGIWKKSGVGDRNWRFGHFTKCKCCWQILLKFRGKNSTINYPAPIQCWWWLQGESMSTRFEKYYFYYENYIQFEYFYLQSSMYLDIRRGVKNKTKLSLNFRTPLGCWERRMCFVFCTKSKQTTFPMRHQNLQCFIDHFELQNSKIKGGWIILNSPLSSKIIKAPIQWWWCPQGESMSTKRVTKRIKVRFQ